MDDSDGLSDLELDTPPKMTFDEAKTQIFREPGLIKEKKELLKAMYYYCKDTKKHSRIIKFLFWPMIISFVQESSNNKISLFGLRLLNSLIQNEATHEQILQMGQPMHASENNLIFQQMLREANLIGTENDAQNLHEKALYLERMKDIIRQAQNPIKILAKKILNTDSTLIMNEATKALKVFSCREDVIHQLWKDGYLLQILREKFETGADPLSQANFLETLASACKYPQYRKELVTYDDIIDILISHIKSMSPRVTLEALKILRLLAKDFQNLEKLQSGKKLRLTSQLIFTFRWLDNKNWEENYNHEVSPQKGGDETPEKGQENGAPLPGMAKVSELDLIYREISKTFQYILFHYDLLKKLMRMNMEEQEMNPNQDGTINQSLERNNLGLDAVGENELIETIIALGKATTDSKTMLNAATSLAHMTEVLHCNSTVATNEAIEFMMTMLKDQKNIKNHRQGCRYFANLSYYSNYIDRLIESKITAYMLGAIEIDTHMNDEDTIKYSVIALANLSSHPNFMKDTMRAAKGGENTQMSKVDRGKIKPLIHLLDSAHQGQINVIQSACITLCNMASKTSLHQHFVEEPEISTLKNCFHSCLKFKGNKDLTNLLRFMIKLVCNLAKNPLIVPHLSKKGFLEIVFEMLGQEREREIFGNIVTAIAYLSVQQDCRDRIIKQDIIPRILQPLNQLTETDQKLIMIALPAMLFNGIELQREFIKNGGIDALLHFLRKKDKLYQQLSCRCVALLSENQEFLQVIIDYECLNNVIVNCIKGKRDSLDIDTMKEILKIFINLVLWRKIKREMIYIACYICDIALMINDPDINMMSVFCLSQLSENEKSHPYLINTTNAVKYLENPQHIAIRDQITENDALEASVQKYSLFSRFNNILDLYDPYALNGQPNQQAYFQSMVTNMTSQNLAEQHKKELMMNLITQTYLNLARNEANKDYLVKLSLFKRLKILIDKYFLHEQLIKDHAASAQNSIFSNPRNPIASGFHMETSMVCYANSIFARILTNDEAKIQCIQEGGHKLFVNILQRPQSYQHLFLETLESMRYFLSNQDFLQFFHEIPKAIVLAEGKTDDLNLSQLQIAAMLSFDPQNHIHIRESGIIRKILRSGIIKVVLKTLKYEKEYAKTAKNRPFNDKSSAWGKQEVATKKDSQNNPQPNRQKSLGLREHEKYKEIALAIVVLFANISCGIDFIGELLAQKTFDQDDNFKDIEERDQEEIEDEDFWEQNARLKELRKWKTLDIKLRDTGMKRIAKLFNIISCKSSYISEQVATILANVTCSGETRFSIKMISDLCMKTLTRIVYSPTDATSKNHSVPSDNTVLAVLITVLNLSSSDQNEIIRGMEFLGYLPALENIIRHEDLTLVSKQVALLGISNLYTAISQNVRNSNKQQPIPVVSADIRLFALNIIRNWQKYEAQGENKELIRNLVYSAIILFFNLIYLRKVNADNDENVKFERIEALTYLLTRNVIPFYCDDQLISSALLEYIHFITKDPELSPIIISNEVTIDFCFSKLKEPLVKIIKYRERQNEKSEQKKSPKKKKSSKSIAVAEPRLIKLSSLALCGFANIISRETCEIFRQKLKGIQNLDHVLSSIKNLGHGEDRSHHKQKQMNEILSPFLQFLQIITTQELTKDYIDSNRVYESIVEILNDRIFLVNKYLLINIIFNLHLKIQVQRVYSRNFIRELYKTYQDYEKQFVMSGSQEENQKNIVQRKIIGLAVSASTKADNHKWLIKEGFYAQFKNNLNSKYPKIKMGFKDNEMFGILNIVLNSKYLNIIWEDLKSVYKLIGLNTDVVDFKTKVNIFTACATFIAENSSQKGGSHQNQQQSDNSLKNLTLKKNKSETIPVIDTKRITMIESSIQSMVYALVQVVKIMLENKENMHDYENLKYLLQAIQDATFNLVQFLDVFIKVPLLLTFLGEVLEQEQDFSKYIQQSPSQVLLQTFDNVVFNHAIKTTVCKIFFNLRLEPNFFKEQKVLTSLQALSKFVLKTNSLPNLNDQKQFLMLNSLRLVSQMINVFQNQNGEELRDNVLSLSILELVKEGILLTKDMQPAINIEAIICLSNMLNVKQIAIHQSVKQSMDNLMQGILLIFFQFHQAIELDEILIAYLHAVSQHEEYIQLIRERTLQMILMLFDRQLKLEVLPSQLLSESQNNNKELQIPPSHNCSCCRRRVLSIIVNITQSNKTGLNKYISMRQLTDLVIRAIEFVTNKSIESDIIVELSFKILINLINSDPELFENHRDGISHQIFKIIKFYYKDFQVLAQQYMIRFIYLLSKMWTPEKLEHNIDDLVPIFELFIFCCVSQTDMKLIVLTLERLSISIPALKALASKYSQRIMLAFNSFLTSADRIPQLDRAIDEIIRFVKRLAKIDSSHQAIISLDLCDLIFTTVGQPSYSNLLLHVSKASSMENQNLETIEKNEIEAIRVLHNLRSAIKIAIFILKNEQIKESVRTEILDLFAQKCSKTLVPILEKIQIDKKNLNISTKKFHNYRFIVEIMGILISDSFIFGTISYDQMRSWVNFFIDQLQLAVNNFNQSPLEEFNQQYSDSWFLKKIVFTIDLLASKNEDKVDQPITKMIFSGIVKAFIRVDEAKSYLIDPLTWMKCLKIGQQMPYLSGFFTIKSSPQQIGKVFNFILVSQQHQTNQSSELLASHYFLKLISLLLSKLDINIIYLSSQNLHDTIILVLKYFTEQCLVKTENSLILENIHLLIELVVIFEPFENLHDDLNKFNIIKSLNDCLQIQYNPAIIRACANALQRASHYSSFLEQLTTTESLQCLLTQIIMNNQALDHKTLLHLQECLRQIIDNATSEAKHAIADIGLEIVATYFDNYKEQHKTDLFDAEGKMIINDLANQIQLMDNTVQFLHIHIHRMFFMDPFLFTNQKTQNLILKLLNFQYSQEFNKLGICVLQSVAAQSPQKAFRETCLRVFFKRTDIINTLFSKYLALQQHSSQEKKQSYQKIRILVTEIIVNILDCCDSLKYHTFFDKTALQLQQIIFIDQNFLENLVQIVLEEKHSGLSKLDIEELKLISRIYSYLPMEILHNLNPPVMTKQVKKATGEEKFVTLESYIKSINVILQSLSHEQNDADSDYQYYALFALFNFLTEAHKQANSNLIKPAFSRAISMKLTQFSIGQNLEILFDSVSLSLLSVCLMKTPVIQTVIQLPMRTRNQNIIRVSLRILILLFSNQAKMLFTKDQSIYDQQVQQSIIPKVEKEREKCRLQLLELLENMRHIEITSPLPGNAMFSADYVNHMHMISQMIYQSLHSQIQIDLVSGQQSIPTNRLLPPVNDFAEIVIRSSLQLQSSEISPNNEYLGENKILLQRYFFYSFMVSAGLTEFLAFSKTIGLFQDMHDSIFTTLSHLMCQLASKSLNDSLDEAIINDIIKQSIRHEKIKQLYNADTLHSASLQGGGTVELKAKDLQESGESTTVALIMMLTTNIAMIVTDQYKVYGPAAKSSEDQPKKPPLQMSQKLFESMVSMLLAYEDFEDVVTGVYDVLRLFIQIAATQKNISGAQGNATDNNCIQMIEANKQILAIAIRHASVYECKKAYDFLIDLFRVSEKFAKHKEIIEKALLQIKPDESNRKSK